jgi:hypothetical protein
MALQCSSPQVSALMADPRKLGRALAAALVALAMGVAAAGLPRAAGAQTSLMEGGAPAAAMPRGGVFTVGGIAVDATSSDAVSARTQAVREGQQAGLDQLLRRLVPASDYGRLPRAANLPIDNYV